MLPQLTTLPSSNYIFCLHNPATVISKRIYFQRERSSSAYQVSAFYMAEIVSELPIFMMQVCFENCVFRNAAVDCVNVDL